jgi:hypothetical protein
MSKKIKIYYVAQKMKILVAYTYINTVAKEKRIKIKKLCIFIKYSQNYVWLWEC